MNAKSTHFVVHKKTFSCFEGVACSIIVAMQWKVQLGREWYPYQFGLKGDLLIASGDMENERISKTQTNALASVLIKQRLSAEGSGS